MNHELKQKTHRRSFIGALATGAAALGIASLASPFRLNAQQKMDKAPTQPMNPADIWFSKIKGKHRMVFDATRPHEILPFAWPKVFLMTNAATGTPENDCGVVVVLRHDAIGYAFQDKMWEKYKFAELFKANDHGPAFQAADAAIATKTRNPFWNNKPDDFKIPGIGSVPIGIKDLQASGVLFCVCNAAMTVFTSVCAQQMNIKQEDIMKEWTANVIPGIQIVPSGLWAIGRAQEHGCKYTFAG